MKNIYLFIFVIAFYLLAAFVNTYYLDINAKIFDFLSKDYPSQVVQNYMESQKKWWWVSYAVTPLLIGIKVLLVAFCLNFLKIVDERADHIRYSDFVFITLIAEFVFIIAGFYKFIYFYWLQTDYTLEDLQTYYPMSLLNLREYISTEKWLAYPLQLVNLFEVFYWVFLVWGINELFENKISYRRSFGYVALTYGIGLAFWVSVVCFIMLNAQY